MTNATRSGLAAVPPTSIITTRGMPARSARNSVWPVNGMPASRNALFCTGAVTSAVERAHAHPSAARRSMASTAPALVGIRMAGPAATVSG